MRNRDIILAGCLLLAFTRAAHAATLQPGLAGLAFLLGHWTCGNGQVAETGFTSRGTSLITAQAGGAVLLRQDHTQLFDKSGKPAGGFDQFMDIYAEAATIHADYFDGTHIIHYKTAAIVPGKSVTFSTGLSAGQPAFQLSYTRNGITLAIAFSIAPPGQTTFQSIATGTLNKAK